MERLDKFISSQTEYSRKDVKKLILQKRVKVNDYLVDKVELKIDDSVDQVKIDDQLIKYQKFVYLVLYKPQGYVSATEDGKFPTVVELVDKKYQFRNLFPVGRLDKDTTGMMIISDDGNFAHEILAPKKHVSKTYRVTIDIKVTEEMVEKFKEGIDLNDGKCKTASLKILGENEAQVILTEGRYHQIKRMFGCFGAKVTKLHRIKIGNLDLPKDLKVGESRELTKEELEKIKEK